MFPPDNVRIAATGLLSAGLAFGLTGAFHWAYLAGLLSMLAILVAGAAPRGRVERPTATRAAAAVRRRERGQRLALVCSEPRDA